MEPENPVMRSLLDTELSSKYPEPVPEDWKAGRAKNTSEWFEKAKEETIRKHQDKIRHVQEAAQKAVADAAAEQRRSNKFQAYDTALQESRSQIVGALQQRCELVSAQHVGEHVLCFPHYTAVRPIAVVQRSQADFKERLFTRALVSTLMANATPAVPSSAPEDALNPSIQSISGRPGSVGQGSSSGAAVASSAIGTAAGGPFGRSAPSRPSSNPTLPANPGSRLGSPGPSASRLGSPGAGISRSGLDMTSAAAAEALGDTMMQPGSVGQDMVWWDVLQPRLAMQDFKVARLEALTRCRVAVIVLSPDCAHSEEFPDERDLIINRLMAQDPHLPPHLKFQVLVARFSSDPHKQPPSFQLPKAPEGHPRASAGVASVEVPCSAPVEEQARVAVEGFRSALAQAEVALPDEVQVHLHPTPALQALPMDLTASLRNSLSALTTNPSATPQDPGASWAAAHQLPYPKGFTKPLEDWSVHDVQVWLHHMGKSISKYASSFLQLQVDGYLLSCMSDGELQQVVGVGSASARATIMQHLSSAMKRTSRLHSTRNILPVGDNAPELCTLTDQQLMQLFQDIFKYCDQDLSGDLDLKELGAMLAACGLKLSAKELADIRDEYDQDDDMKINLEEAVCVLWDVWRLVLAARDAAAWNVPSKASLYDEFLSPFEMPSRMNTADVSRSCAVSTSGAFGPKQAGQPAITTKPWANSRAVSLNNGATRAGGLALDAMAQSSGPWNGAMSTAGSVAGRSTHHARQPHVSAAGNATGLLSVPLRNNTNPRDSGHNVSFGQQHTSSSAMASKAGTAASSVRSTSKQSGKQPAATGRRVSVAFTDHDLEGASSQGRDSDSAGDAISGWKGGHVAFVIKPGPTVQDLDAKPFTPPNAKQSVAATQARRLNGNADDDNISIGTTVITNLDVFADVAFNDGTSLKEPTDTEALAEALQGALDVHDLRRNGVLPSEAVRAALTYSEATSELTPYELRVLAGLAGESGDVAANTFIERCQRTINHNQQQLMESVYSPSGTQLLLIKLHDMAHPKASHVSRAASSADGEVPQAINLQPATSMPISDHAVAAPPFFPLEHAPHLLNLLTEKLGVQLPQLVAVGILQEAAAAADRAVGSGHEVAVWSSVAAHMLHVYHSLQTPPYTQQFY